MEGKLMTMSKIRIHGFRGFRTSQVLDLASPDGTPGSGLTILTGPNNSGKSTIVECIRVRKVSADPSLAVEMRNAATDYVEIDYVVNGVTETLRSLELGSSETRRKGVSSYRSLVLPSRRSFQPYFGKSTLSRDQYVTSNVSTQRQPTLSGFEHRLFTIIDNRGEFDKLLGNILGYQPSWSIDYTSQGQHFLKFKSGGSSHTSEGMGDGIISIFAIADALYDSKPGELVVIDEPELSLHPTYQKRVAETLKSYAADRQIVITTHSPYFVDLKSLSVGAQLARVTTTHDEGSRIFQLSDSGRAAIKKLASDNLFNPHVLGLDARELFFQEDRIVLVEGQEDVQLLPRVAAQLNRKLSGNPFGWGAGGADNFDHLCLVFEQLGFRKVAGILDADKKTKASELKTKFPSYDFVTIPAADIRTKPGRPATLEKVGLVDGDKKIRPEFGADTSALIDRINAYMA